LVIYGEYLFIENMITGALILSFTAKILGIRLSTPRIILCSACCGGYAFVLFFHMAGLFSIAGKLIFSLAMAVLAFGKASPKRLLQNAAVFLGVTILYGGIAMAILTSFGWTGVTAAAGIYLPPLTYVTITAVASCSAWFVWLLLHIFSVKRLETRTRVKTVITVDRQSWVLQGMIDSGNTLKDPLSGKPVCIVRKTLMENLLLHMEHPERRYTVIPYHSVGVEQGLLDGYRMDKLTVGREILKSPVVAVCEEEHFFRDGQDLEILLPGMMLERGLHGDDWTDENLAGKITWFSSAKSILHRRKRRAAATADAGGRGGNTGSL